LDRQKKGRVSALSYFQRVFVCFSYFLPDFLLVSRLFFAGQTKTEKSIHFRATTRLPDDPGLASAIFHFAIF